jgi:hypothetical protein
MAPAPHRLTEAIERSTAFLKRQLLAGDYGMSCVRDDGLLGYPHNKGHIFIGFHIAEALADSLTEVERAVLLVRVLSEENGGLWGFHSPAPFVSPEHLVFVVEADDTSYALRLLRRLGVTRSPQRLLAFHRWFRNRFVTYNSPGFGRLATVPSVRNNFAAHPEVNANVFHALRGTAFERYINETLIRETQTPEGFWPSYFYPSRYFATHMFLDLIHGRASMAAAEQKGIAFLRASQNADGSWGEPGDPYETALATSSLAACAIFDEPFDRGIAYLLHTVGEDGSWSSAKYIWEFHDPGGVFKGQDIHRSLVTALCTVPLKRAVARD